MLPDEELPVTPALLSNGNICSGESGVLGNSERSGRFVCHAKIMLSLYG